VKPTEGPLTQAGLEICPRGIYDLETQISREYDHPIIEMTECDCCYMATPYEKENGRVPDVRCKEFFTAILADLSRAIAYWGKGARIS
jgi:beta-glucosidase